MLTKLTKSLLHTTDNYINALEKGGISTVSDLLNHYPREYEDRTNVLDSFSLLNLKEKNTILVTLISLNTIKTGGGKLLSKAVLEDKNGFLSEAVWFNRKYLATTLKPYEGKKLLVSGKVKYSFGKITFQSPEVETDLSKVSGEIVPIYSDINYIPTKWIAPKIELLKNYIKQSNSNFDRNQPHPSPDRNQPHPNPDTNQPHPNPDTNQPYPNPLLRGEGIEGIQEDLPESIIKKYNFISKAEAVYKIHFPNNKNDIEIAKYRLAYGELFEINYNSISTKYEAFKNTEGKALPIKMNPELVKEILTHLPFDLTDHQKIVLFQILKDMEKPHSMQRLLEGDVGTGKTVVALIAGIHAIVESQRISSPDAETPPSIPDTNQPHPNPDTNQPHPNPLLRGEGIEGRQERLFEEVGIREDYLEVPEYIKELAKDLRKYGTEAEKILWEVLRNRKFEGLKFRRQHPFGRYIADFYCDEIKLVIELDGKVHDNQKEYDEIRDEIINQYGVQILRIKNEDVLNNLTSIYKKIIPYTPSPLRRGLGGGVLGGEQGGGLLKLGTSHSIQVAIMAPTEILARQHFESMQELLMAYKISSHLLVGSLSKKQKEAVKADIKMGNIDLVIGTHALVQEDVNFYNLGFIVIDEQHRFGVKQRQVLEQGFGNKTGLMPHCLNMTATPIPRTLALTLYGDQDLSIISQYPKGRKDIYTKVAKTENQRYEIELFVRAEIEKGRQIFWISPLVQESEKIDLANAISTYESLIDKFYPFRVGLLHGKMKPKEKDAVMKEFTENKIQILSSTSVVEVGVDIPNATIMCIEGAERFGLSQLHQFRGRVGRGKYQSYCYLFPTTGNYTDRLKAMESTNNGFELAEIDLEIRGPGEVYGLRQSGVPDLKIADLKDLQLISQIREDIEELFEKK